MRPYIKKWKMPTSSRQGYRGTPNERISYCPMSIMPRIYLWRHCLNSFEYVQTLGKPKKLLLFIAPPHRQIIFPKKDHRSCIGGGGLGGVESQNKPRRREPLKTRSSTMVSSKNVLIHYNDCNLLNNIMLIISVRGLKRLTWTPNTKPNVPFLRGIWFRV